MSYVYSKVEDLEGGKKVGSRECVALIRRYTSVPLSSTWSKGEDVMSAYPALRKGTAIATFVDGQYPSLKHGNHAAFFLRMGANGFWVMDQWANDRAKPVISSRFISIRQPGVGSPSDNAANYSVIE